MGTQPDTNRPAPESGPLLLRRLLPCDDPATAEEIVAGLDLRRHAAALAHRPYLILNMVSTADGRATIGGR